MQSPCYTVCTGCVTSGWSPNLSEHELPPLKHGEPDAYLLEAMKRSREKSLQCAHMPSGEPQRPVSFAKLRNT